MKNLLLIAIAFLGFSIASFAQNSATVTATAGGTIVTPITIVKDFNMEFGTLVAASGTVVLNPGAVPTYSSVVAFTGTTAISPTAAKFTVSGDFDNLYTVNVTSLPTSVKHATDAATMLLSDWTSTANLILFENQTGTGTGTLSGTGTQSFEIGAKLTVSGTTQKAGVYTSVTPFSVTVIYQ